MPPTPEQIQQLFDLHNSPERRQENLWRSYGFDPARNWAGEGGYRLSDNLWIARQDVRRQIDDLIRQAIANGTDALELADMVEQFLNPQYSPVRNALGRLIRNQRRGIVTRTPGRGGMGSFAARRLARTEVTRAHGQATIEAAKRTPFAKGVKWSTSTSHPKPDPCDENASRNAYNLGPGVYPPDKVPRYPEHPQCLCVLSTAVTDDVDSVVESLREQYSLGDNESGADALTDAIAGDVSEWRPVRSESDARAWARQNGGTLADKTFYHFTKAEFVDSIRENGLRVGGGSLGEFVYTTAQDANTGIGLTNVPEKLRLVTSVKNPLVVKYDDLWHKKKGLGKYKVIQRDLLYSDKWREGRLHDALRADGYDALIIDWEGASFGGSRGQWFLAFDTKDITIIEDAT